MGFYNVLEWVPNGGYNLDINKLVKKKFKISGPDESYSSRDWIALLPKSEHKRPFMVWMRTLFLQCFVTNSGNIWDGSCNFLGWVPAMFWDKFLQCFSQWAGS